MRGADEMGVCSNSKEATHMKVAIIIALLINVPTYIWQYIGWLKDCKKIGKEDLAVSLGERMSATMLVVTIPCIVGILFYR